MKKILYISYNGLLEPIFQSQALSYILKNQGRAGDFILLTFEKIDYIRSASKKRINGIKSDLSVRGIDWYRLPYHKRPFCLSTFFDVIVGILFVTFIICTKPNIRIIHCRGSIPAAIGIIPAKIFRKRMIFDLRGLLAEEYADAEVWKRGSFLYMLINLLEKTMLIFSDKVIVLTKNFSDYLKNDKFLPHWAKINQEIIPCCVDLDKFSFRAQKDEVLLERLNLKDKFIFFYGGSVGSWYLFGEMVDFFKVAKRFFKTGVFLVLSHSEKNEIESIFKSREIDPSDYRIAKADFNSMPDYLSLADAGMLFYKPDFSRRANSPTKIAEYLACGKPVVLNRGIGDTEAMLKKYNTGVIIKGFNLEEYEKALNSLKELLIDSDGLHLRCRKTAEEFLSLDKGTEKYKLIYDNLLN